MRQIKHCLFLLSVLLLSLTSCSKDDAYKNALPADAFSVCSFDIKSMAKKAGTDNKDAELRNRLAGMLSDSEEAEAYYKELIDHPSKSGIDLTSPAYLFSNEKVDVGYLLRVDDKDKLETCVNKIRKFHNKDVALKAENGIFFDIDEDSTEPEEVEYAEDVYDNSEENSDTTAVSDTTMVHPGTTYHVSGNVTLYAFNDKAFIVLNTRESTIEETKQLAKQYLTQSKDKSYVATAPFRDLEEQKGDIRGVLSMAKFLDSSYGKSMTENIVGLSDATNFDGIDMKKCYMLYSVSFETGEVVGTMTYGSEDKEILKKLKKLSEEVSPKSVQDDLIKLLPKDSYMTAAATISAQKLLEHYSKLPTLKETLSKLKEEGVDIEAIVPTLGEEIAFTFPHINAEQSDFGLVGYLKTKDATLVDMLYQQAEKEHSGKYVKDGGEHRYRNAEDPFFFGYQDGVTYLAYGGMGRELLFKTSGENFTKHSEYSSLKKGNSFSYIDLKKLLTTAPTSDLLQMFIGEKAKAFHVLQSLSFTATNLDGKMSLKIDSKENSLKTLADLFAALQ
jgi:lipoprotein